MRFAIISDIHGNLAALQSVVERIKNENCDKVICLGDLVGYGPHPNECVEIVREIADIIIIGNHDHAAIGLTDTRYFNPHARAAIAWTSAVLTNKSKDFLAQLDFVARDDEALFVHATPCEPEKWDYILNAVDAAINFRCFKEFICFVGHSHIPVRFARFPDRHVKNIQANPLNLELENRYIINVGSVGQPRDGDAKAAFTIYNYHSDARTVELVRVPYDIESTQQAMVENNLPQFLVERLECGR